MRPRTVRNNICRAAPEISTSSCLQVIALPSRTLSLPCLAQSPGCLPCTSVPVRGLDRTCWVRLQVKVYDDDTITDDDGLGKAEFTLATLMSSRGRSICERLKSRSDRLAKWLNSARSEFPAGRQASSCLARGVSPPGLDSKRSMLSVPVSNRASWQTIWAGTVGSGGIPSPRGGRWLKEDTRRLWLRRIDEGSPR